MSEVKPRFLTVAEFKAEINSPTLEVYRNPNTGILSMKSAQGTNYKCQGKANSKGELDITKPMYVLVPVEGVSEACLNNGVAGQNTVAVL